jgi:hypothetical protein
VTTDVVLRQYDCAYIIAWAASGLGAMYTFSLHSVAAVEYKFLTRILFQLPVIHVTGLYSGQLPSL